MEISIETGRDAAAPYKQIVEQIIAEIKEGALSEGETLPSVRMLAQHLDVSPSTVNRAYVELEDKGYLEAFAGKGVFVSALKGDIETQSTTWKAFFSYARKDDERTYGAITKLKKAIVNEYAYVTGNDLDIFQDKDDIDWGDNWRKEIKENLGNTYFFIPILTPTYLRRPSCLGELKNAFRAFKDTNNERGIFPIRFADCADAIESLNDDELAGFLKSANSPNWSDLQYEDPSSSDYRRSIRKIVDRMIAFDASHKWEEEALVIDDESSLDDEMGLIDRIAFVEEDMDNATNELAAISALITEVGDMFSSQSVPDNATFGQRLAVMKELSKELESPADDIERHTKEYSHLMGKVDSGVHAIIECASLGAPYENSASHDDKVSFHMSMKRLNEDTKPAFVQMKNFCAVLRNTERLSKDLRKPIRRIRSSVEDIGSSQHYYQDWERVSKKLIQDTSEE